MLSRHQVLTDRTRTSSRMRAFRTAGDISVKTSAWSASPDSVSGRAEIERPVRVRLGGRRTAWLKDRGCSPAGVTVVPPRDHVQHEGRDQADDDPQHHGYIDPRSGGW